MDSVLGINHIGISVRDMRVARDFWVALGLAEVSNFAWGPGSTRADEALGLVDSAAEVVILAGATAYLELFAFSAPVPAARGPRSPGIAEVTLTVRDLDQVTAAASQVGAAVEKGSDGGARTRCPEGTPVVLVEGDHIGLRSVVVRVVDPSAHPLVALTPASAVSLAVVDGSDGVVARPCDLGANHVCLDVEGIASIRTGLGDRVRWNHDITSSSGGIASVCYGTTVDGVLVELLENNSPEATLSRRRLSRP